MKIVKADDKSKAVCDTCEKLCDVTFGLRDVALSDGSDVVNNVLVGTCDVCNNVCVLPHQSVPAVSETISKQRKAVESRVPAHMVDILNAASVAVGADIDFGQHLLKYYLHALAHEEISPSQLVRFLRSDLAGGKAQKRISIKGRDVLEDIEGVKALTSLRYTSEIIKSVILKINYDILQRKAKKPLKALEGIAAACR